MTKHILTLLIAWYVSTATLYGQRIEMYWPKFAGKTYDFILFQGDKQVKAIQDTIPEDGHFILEIPAEYTPYKGMCRWLLTNTTEGGGLDMAMPGFGFSVSCLEATPNEKNIIYRGYDASYELNRLSRQQQSIIEKFELMSRSADLYGKSHPLYTVFEKEVQLQKVAFEDFKKQLMQNPNYNARFLPIVNLTRGISPSLTNDNGERAKLVIQYITEDLDFDDLYTSGHWTFILQSWVELHLNIIRDESKLIRDFDTMGKRISDSKKYTDFAGKITYFLTKYGKDNIINKLTPIVVNSSKVSEYLGTMAVYIKAMIGAKAPSLVLPNQAKLESQDFAMGSYQKTLLVFFASECGHCDALMNDLQLHYSTLKAQKIRVIAIAADTNKEVFETSKTRFPWKDTFCDFQGMNGTNFKSYAVPGTPTLFLIDKQGMILQKTSDLHEVIGTDNHAVTNTPKTNNS